MLNTITNSSEYLSVVAALAAENKRSSASAGTSPDASRVLAIQNIKNAVAAALVAANSSSLPASIEEIEPREASDADAEMRRIETFTSLLAASARMDETSTADRPVVYIETTEDGETKAYRVDIDAVDVDDMSRLEALALIRYMQSDPQWSDLTYSDILTAMSALFGGSRGTTATRATMAEQIGRYLKPTSTYDASGSYAKMGTVSVFEENRELREASRAMRLQMLTRSIVTGKDGSKSIAPGVYL